MYNSGKLDKIFKGEKAPVYIICEIGINHNGSLDRALRLIEEAHKAHVDAVKFQKRNLKEIYCDDILNDSNSAEWNFDYLIPLLKETELTYEDYRVIRDKCDELELDLIITPFDKSSADFILELGISAFKIASADMTNIELVEQCGISGKPVIISTGMWSKDEIKKCVNIYKEKDIDFALLHAQSTYPSPYETLNLNFINELKDMVKIVGYSGHERGIFIPIASVSMGCQIIEKHITLDKEMTGPDHKASMLPEEWVTMVSDIRMLEIALDGDKSVNQAETLNKELFAKSAVPKSNLLSGHVLKKNDVIFKSPGKGIFPHEIDQFYGKVLNRPVGAHHYISKEDFEDTLEVKDWQEFNFTNQWGFKCRFHDYELYDVLPSHIVEFHCSQNDLELDFKPTINPNTHGLIVHAPEIFDRKLFDICSYDKKRVEESRIILEKTIHKTLELAQYFPNVKPSIVVHLGGMSLDIREMKETRHLMDNAIKNFKGFEQYKDSVDILPENLPSRPWYFGGEWYQHGFASAEDMIYFCQYYDLKITYDVCHALLYCNNHGKDIVDYTKKIMPFAKHVHISDAQGINGEGLQIGNGDMDFDRVFEAMKGYEFSWVTEIWSGHLHNGSGSYKALQILNDKYNNIL